MKSIEIYEPSEDSYLLSEVLKKKIQMVIKDNQDIKFLDMGAGSGIQGKTAIKYGIKKENVYFVDISKEVVKKIKSEFKHSTIINSNLFSKVSKNQKFDLIAFNPPYLPLDEREPKSSRLATTGGKKGSEIINRFLIQAKSHLNKKGKIFLVTSSLTKSINWRGYKIKQIAKKKVFFEELYVWELII